MKFDVQTTNPGPLAIHELMQWHANELWVPEHLYEEQAAAFVLDHFRQQIEAELAMVTSLTALHQSLKSTYGYLHLPSRWVIFRPSYFEEPENE